MPGVSAVGMTLSTEEYGGAAVENVEGFFRVQHLGHGAHARTLILVCLPVRVGHAPDQGVEEVSRIEVALGKRILLDLVQCQRDDGVQPDLLRDEQPQTLGGECTDGTLAQRVSRADQPCRAGRRVAPAVVLNLFE